MEVKVRTQAPEWDIDSLVNELVNMGIPVTISKGESGKIASFSSGFYKSDGSAWLEQTDSGIVLHTRYGQADKIEGPFDVIEISRDWYERSRDRFDGWSVPNATWKPLYDLIRSMAVDL